MPGSSQTLVRTISGSRSRHWLSTAIATALLLGGCSKPPADQTAAPADTQTAPAGPDAAQPVIASADTQEAPTNAGAAFAVKSHSSPFVSAAPALRETYDRALIAFQIEDYARAISELDDLARQPDLTDQQKEAINALLDEALKMAPDAPRNLAGQAPIEVNTNSLSEDVFTTANNAVRRSYARALTAYKIGDYATALSELKDLSGNAELNAQQKNAVQFLLDRTPQSAPVPNQGK